MEITTNRQKNNKYTKKIQNMERKKIQKKYNKSIS